jgi:hypothetical protein
MRFHKWIKDWIEQLGNKVVNTIVPSSYQMLEIVNLLGKHSVKYFIAYSSSFHQRLLPASSY